MSLSFADFGLQGEGGKLTLLWSGRTVVHFDRLSMDLTFGSTSWNPKKGKRPTPGFEARDAAFQSSWIKVRFLRLSAGLHRCRYGGYGVLGSLARSLTLLHALSNIALSHRTDRPHSHSSSPTAASSSAHSATLTYATRLPSTTCTRIPLSLASRASSSDPSRRV